MIYKLTLGELTNVLYRQTPYGPAPTPAGTVAAPAGTVSAGDVEFLVGGPNP